MSRPKEVTPIPKAPKKPPAARKRVRPVSVRRLSEKEARAHVRGTVIARDNYRCVGPDRGLPDLCSSPFPDRPPLEVHEAFQRSTHPGSHLRPDDCVTLCQTHHDAVTSPVGEARQRALDAGLIVKATT